MGSFSERNGYKELRTVVQLESLDLDVRQDLWNLFALLLEIPNDSNWDMVESNILDDIWVGFLRKLRDERPPDHVVWKEIKKAVISADWNRVLDFVEAFLGSWENRARQNYGITSELREHIVEALNSTFKKNLVGYRIIGNQVIPIDSTTFQEALEAAMGDVTEFNGVKHAFDRAISLLSDRTTPDYPNAVKEAIASVEALVRVITKKSVLSAGLKELEKAGLKIHPALNEAWTKMYGWTSDEGGIRHASIDTVNIDQSLAKYMVVTCAAFLSYLVEEGRKVNLLQ